VPDLDFELHAERNTALGITFMSLTDPPLTTVRQPIEAIGQRPRCVTGRR
jgi:hypothetical protein